jgi:hypothetical protein
MFNSIDEQLFVASLSLWDIIVLRDEDESTLKVIV